MKLFMIKLDSCDKHFLCTFVEGVRIYTAS